MVLVTCNDVVSQKIRKAGIRAVFHKCNVTVFVWHTRYILSVVPGPDTGNQTFPKKYLNVVKIYEK